MLTRKILRFIALTTFAVAPALASAGPNAPFSFKHVYVIGDSLSDQGNLFIATGLLGLAVHAPPIPDAQHYWFGRFSNGPNYVDRLAIKLRTLIVPSVLGGTNFAFGGARIDYNRVEDRSGAPPWQPTGPYPGGFFKWSVNDQRQAFVDSVNRHGADPTGLYIVFAGSNDLEDALIASAFYGQPAAPIVQNAVAGVVNVVNTFKAAGAQTILVPLTPDFGVVPSVTALGPNAIAAGRALSSAFNQALMAALRQIDGPNIIVFDTFALLDDVVFHPGHFGFTNVSQPCYTGFVTPDPTATECRHPQQYAFWDSEHPTTRLDSILADGVFGALVQCLQRGTSQGPAYCGVNRH